MNIKQHYILSVKHAVKNLLNSHIIKTNETEKIKCIEEVKKKLIECVKICGNGYGEYEKDVKIEEIEKLNVMQNAFKKAEDKK